MFCPVICYTDENVTWPLVPLVEGFRDHLPADRCRGGLLQVLRFKNHVLLFAHLNDFAAHQAKLKRENSFSGHIGELTFIRS